MIKSPLLRSSFVLAQQPKSSKTFKETAKLWMDLARLRFLAYSPVWYGFGIAAAHASGLASEGISLGAYIHGLCLIWTVHVMTHFVNEAEDFETDRLNMNANGWTGGSGVLPRHPEMRPACIRAGWVLLFVSYVLGLALDSSKACIVAVVLTTLSWQYSGAPLRLNGEKGIGEIIVALVLTVLTPTLGFFLAAGDSAPALSPQLFYNVVPSFLMGFSRQLIMNLPDVEADTKVGKLNMCCRMGTVVARRVFVLGTVIAYGLVWTAANTGAIAWSVAFWQSAALPLALYLVGMALSPMDDDTLAAQNMPFLCSLHLCLYGAFGVVGQHLDAEVEVSHLLLWGVVLFFLATLKSVKKIINGKKKE